MNVPRPLPRRTVTPPEVDGALAGGLLVGGGIAIAAMLVASLLFGWSPSPVTWYVARASGLVLYLLTWLLMALGLGLTTRAANDAGGRGVTYSLHAYAFHLWYGFLTLHVLSLAIDPTVDFGPRALLVPFASGVREPWTGLGVLAAEVSVIVGASFAARRLIGYRAWRALHWLAFPTYLAALAHGFGAGSDRAALPVQLLYLVTTAVLLYLGAYRVLARGQRRAPRGQAAAPVTPYDRLGHAQPRRPAR